MDLKPGTRHRGYFRRPRVHRLLHEFAAGRSARGRASRCRKARHQIAQAGAGRSWFARGESSRRKRRSRQDFPRRRIRMARCGLQHVHRDESTTCCPAASAPPAPRTATSKAARARAAGRTWSARSWPQRPQSKAISWTSANWKAVGRSRINNAALHQAHWIGRAHGPRQRRHRPDGPQAILEAADARRVWPRPVLRLALPSRRKTES